MIAMAFLAMTSDGQKSFLATLTCVAAFFESMVRVTFGNADSARNRGNKADENQKSQEDLHIGASALVRHDSEVGMS